MPITPVRATVLFLCVLTALLAVGAQEAGGDLRWNADLRPAMTPPATAPYLRSWLLCGPFTLNVPMQPPYDGSRVNAAAVQDFLRGAGGETAVRPVAGQVVPVSDHTTVKWTKYESPDTRVNLTAAFGGTPVFGAVAYAYTTLHRDAPGKVYLAGASDDGMRLWVNGKLVYDNLCVRGLFEDDDLIAVEVPAGDNAILVKVEQVADYWAFCLRVVDPAAAPVLLAAHQHPSKVWPSLATDAAGRLVIVTDGGRDVPSLTYPSVELQVTGAGGRVRVKETVRYRARQAINTTSWPDGAYDVTCRLQRPDGSTMTAHQTWYKGDAWAATQRLLATAPKPDSPAWPAMVHAMLVDDVRFRLGDDVEHARPEQLPGVFPALAEWEEARQFADGGQGPFHANGFLHLAYLDEIDGAPQFCRAYLPAHYDPRKQWPLVVNLHGYHPRNPTYIRWWGNDRRFDSYPDQGDVITIYPHGRGNTSYLGIGERDVLRCIALAKQQLSVDDNRVYLTGASMGGSGTWTVGTRHPELFAGIAPVYGGWDYRLELSADEMKKLTLAEQYRLESWSSFAQLESLLSTPVFVNHGDADTSVEVANSRYAVRQLQRWGYDVQYWEHPGKGHEALGCEDTLLAWMLAHRRNANPAHVRLRAAELKSAAAHWVRVEQRDDQRAVIQADAEIIAPNTIRLDTQNVLSITLSPAGPLIDPRQPIWVTWNTHDIRQAQLHDGRVTLNAVGYTPTTLHKRPALEGPASETTNTPFAIVQGTIAPDLLMRKFCERQVNLLVADWQRRQHWTPRVYKDTEISPAEQAKYSLLLIGGPNENAISRQLAGKIPLATTTNTMTVDGHVITAVDAVAQVVYPSPLNTERYISSWVPTSTAGMYFADRMDTDLDYCLVDGRNGFLAQGYFDNTWQFAVKYLEEGDTKARAEGPLRKAPTRITAQTPENSLWLAELLESSASGGFATMVRDASMTNNALCPGAGDTYRHGIAVPLRRNTSVEYDVTGTGWKRLRAVVGVERNPAKSIPEKERDSVQVVFIVKGDDKELYRSQPFHENSPAQTIAVDITGVAHLRLEVVNQAGYDAPVQSIDWADLRLEK